MKRRIIVLATLVLCACSEPLVAPVAIDGDTIAAAGKRVRLVGIDAPEMPGHCRAGRNCAPGDPVASKEALQAFLDMGSVHCEREPGVPDTDFYGRQLRRCFANGHDLSELMLEAGMAIRYEPRER